MRNRFALVGALSLMLAIASTALSQEMPSVSPTSQPSLDGAQLDANAAGPVQMTATERTKLQDLDARRIHQFNNADLAEYLSLKSKATRLMVDRPHPRAEAAKSARQTLDQPFRLNAVQFDPAEGDCVSCVNRQLALSVAWDWNSYVILTERLRHKDGIVEYKNRNFQTLQDWVPNNTKWLLDDVTGQLGPAADPPAKKFTYPVRAKLFEEFPAAPGSKYKRVVFKGWDPNATKTEVWPSLFIPTDRMPEVMADLQEGDVVLVLRQARQGHLDCDHMGMIVNDAGTVMLAHSVPPEAIREPLLSLLGRCHWVVGLKFLRLREDAREIAAQEVARLSSTIPVPTPAQQDFKITRLRQQRQAASGKQ